MSCEERRDQSSGLLVQIASYNTNLQGSLGLPQDLVDWLSPTFQVSTFLTRERKAPDIIAVGFQELLPLHLGLSGFSATLLEERNALILSQIEEHAKDKQKYSLIAKVVNVGVALLVYGRDDGVARKVCDVQTQWTGVGPFYMGNKGAVGVRFRVPGTDGEVGETFTFVCAHLTAHQRKLGSRLADYRHIVATLLFPAVPGVPGGPSTLYSTSHVFFLGDLNFRLDIPTSDTSLSTLDSPGLGRVLDNESRRAELKEYDQLLVQMRKGTAFIGFHEGEFWKFKCSYKYELGEVDKYSSRRIPAWTDRILYATYTDSPDMPLGSSITNVLYTSIPGYTTSDHKPIVCLLLLPSPPKSQSSPLAPPMIHLPKHYSPTPDSLASIKRYTGRVLDRIVGTCWLLLVFFGAGSGVMGLFNCILSLGAWTWWKSRSDSDRHS